MNRMLIREKIAILLAIPGMLFFGLLLWISFEKGNYFGIVLFGVTIYLFAVQMLKFLFNTIFVRDKETEGYEYE